MEEVFAKMRALISDQFAVEESFVTEETNFEGDLGADSVDLVELVMELEEEFDIGEIPEEDLAGMKTVGDTVRYIVDHRK